MAYTTQEIDRLSSLPDDALKTILSFLPTRSAISSSILSSSWCRLWTDITALRFTVNYIPSPQFDAFLFHVLRRVTWPKIKAIELNIEPPKLCTPSYIYPKKSFIDVIRNILDNGPCVKELKVNFINFINSGNSSYLTTLPTCIFETKSIEVLEVHGFKLESEEINSKLLLPNLRKLVTSICDSDLQFIGNLVKSCQSLEILVVHVDVLDKFKDPIEIEAHKLKWLSIKVSFMKVSCENKVVVDAPKLKHLEVDSPAMLKFCFRRTPTELAKANVFLGDRSLRTDRPYDPKQGLLGLVNLIFQVSTLKLRGDIVRALGRLESNVVKFHKLTHLEMGSSGRLGWKGVVRFLQSTPNLECLVLRWEPDESHKYMYYKREKHEITPCILTKLEKIELWWFRDVDFVFGQMIDYTIRAAKELKTLHYFVDASKDNQRLSLSVPIKLRELSWKLPACEVKIIGMSDVPRL